MDFGDHSWASCKFQGSLIPDTLKEMEEDEDFKLTAAKLREMGQKKLLKEERKRRQRALSNLNLPNFETFWKQKKMETEGQGMIWERGRLIDWIVFTQYLQYFNHLKMGWGGGRGLLN